MQQAKAVQNHAFAPYSRFRVGAALLTSTGETYTGCNVENSSYSLSVCAERVAVFKAVSAGEKAFEAIVVVTDSEDFCPPCGACRQVLVEFAPKLSVIMMNAVGEARETTIQELLPEAFSADFLKGREEQ